MLTPKQEKFALNLFSGMSHRRAWIEAGYSSNYSMAVLDTHASVLAHKDKVKIRVAELQAPVDSALISGKIATEGERKEILSEIARAKVGGFIDETGVIDKGKLDSSAIQAIDQKGKGITKLRLHNPISAISELNKMERLYEEVAPVSDNRVINIYIQGEGAREKLKRLLAGEKPEDVKGTS